ncbi:hypothetical protein F4821DRAFT_154404 [Hypoxylon rubiginosum]|uniref:Uncharacterized protein n=1 Tax=Hypoxylon rubiginosum TaxID=110542 RepID=A0ACC0CXH6_9PEZI|nr:hypothetical protein F4821DRAFT_154404 [Hypoxylon rubiginosum]
MNHQHQPPGGQIIDLQSTPANHALAGKYRRNGKLQSCEPCRRSKLRCDHVVPACGRCVRRRCVDQCVYHPNPLTQSRRASEITPLTPVTSTNEESSVSIVQSIETSRTESPSIITPPTVLPRSTEAVGREVHRAASAPPLHLRDESNNRSGRQFLGETSYVSIFADGLGGCHDLTYSHAQKVRLSHDKIVQGCKILSFLKDKPSILRYVSRWYEICEDEGCICIEPIMKEWLWGLGINHGDVLRDQNPEKIRRLVELLWRNTQTSIIFDEKTTVTQWAKLATGPNIRWEVIGLIAAIVGQCASTPEPSDRFAKKHNLAHPSFPRQMSEIAEACLAFTRECEVLGDMYIWLLMENYCLTGMVKGESSHATYTQGGDIIASAVAMGLHQGVKTEDRLPFFLSQVRRRLFAQTYSAEIGIATFLGRPPRISYRYCNLQPPLDISVAQMILEEDELALALAGLDENGFNTAGKIQRVTWTKTWLGCAPEREAILDLALGQYTRDEIVRLAGDIQRRSKQYWDGLPAFIKRVRDGPLDVEGRTPNEILYMTVMRQAFRANDLLLQRVLIRKAGATSEKLIHVARSILKDILLMSQRHDLGALFQTDIASLLAVQGMRSAAVIAVELLKQEQLPVYPKEPLLPRSQTIQDLSVFAARLGAIDPADGSFAICDQGRKVITHILDRILSPPAAPDRQQSYRAPTVPRDQLQQPNQMGLDLVMNEPVPGCGLLHVPGVMDPAMTDLNFGIEVPFLGADNDFMQWLENMDWERPVQ